MRISDWSSDVCSSDLRPENAGRSLILPRNMKYQSVGLSNEDVQWLAAQQFGVAEVARIYRVPPILIQELTHATFTNTIELGAQLVRFSLARWISMWEQEKIGRASGRERVCQDV